MEMLQRAGQDLALHMRDLFVAILGNDSPVAADSVVEAAQSLGIDPLDYCIHRLGLDETVVLERAANWAGLAFAATVPRLAPGSVRLDRIDHLSTVRTMRAALMGRDITFCAPNSKELVRLALLAVPQTARRICVVPARAIRRALADASSQALAIRLLIQIVAPHRSSARRGEPSIVRLSTTSAGVTSRARFDEATSW